MRRPIGPIGQCSAKLRRAIEIDEEEALLGTVRIRRRPKTADEEGKAGSKGGGRFFVEPDFRVPGPFSSRPLSPQGHVSFHFSRDTVSKALDGTSIVSTSSGPKRLTRTAPADHDSYIARPDAVMTISAADFESYAARDKAIDDIDDGRGAILSNISSDSLVRRDFWLKVHKYERKPEPDALELRARHLSSADWIRLSTLASVPADVRQLAIEMAACGESRKGDSNKPDAVLPMDRGKAEKLIKAIRSELGHWNGKAPPLRVRKGRGGRTQFRLTAEFPDGLDGSARLAIAHSFCRHLEQIGVMYTAAIHAPDEHNDEKNFHLHVAYYDRPARLMPGTELWDFEIREKVPGQHERYRYPHRQPKIGKLVRDPNGGNFREYAADQIYGLREYFEQLSNAALKKAGCTRLFDARTYEKMGIDQQATRPLGPTAAALQAVGVPTAIGTDNAEILGTAALQRVRQECTREAEERQALRSQVANTLSGRVAEGADDTALAAASARFEQAASIIDAHDLESREYDVWLQIAEAAPKKTIDTCSRILKAIETGKATRADQRQEDRINARKNAADRFLADVCATREGHEDVLREVRTELQEAKEVLAIAVADIMRLLKGENRRPILATVDRGGQPALVEEPTPDNSRSTRIPTVSGDKDRSSPGDVGPSPDNSVHDRLDEILERILNENRPIMLPDNEDGRYRVPGISRPDYQMLNSPPLQALVQSRLAEIAKIQRARMANVARFVAHFGEGSFRRAAEKHFMYARMHEQFEAFRGFPVFEAMLLEERLKKDSDCQEATTPARSRKSRSVGEADRHKLGKNEKLGFLSRWFRSTEEPAIGVPTANAKPTWTPAAPIQQPAKDDRQQAILALADAIRTDSAVRLLNAGGVLAVDMTSMPGWETSLSVFNAEETVRGAIAERWAKEVERKNAVVRGQIVAAVGSANRRPVKRMNERWVVSGIDATLLQRANAWQEHPELASSYRQVDEWWRNVEASTGADLARHAAMADAPRKSEPSQGPAVPPSQVQPVTLEQQAEYLAHRAQQTR